jgi:hypothetical protein
LQSSNGFGANRLSLTRPACAGCANRWQVLYEDDPLDQHICSPEEIAGNTPARWLLAQQEPPAAASRIPHQSDERDGRVWAPALFVTVP